MDISDLKFFKVKNKEKEKIKKDKISELSLEKNTDILGHISNHNSLRPKLVVGFAAETNDLENYARGKNILITGPRNFLIDLDWFDKLMSMEENNKLANQAEELANYKSEFFGRLRTVLMGQERVRIVGDRFVFSSEVLLSVFFVFILLLLQWCEFFTSNSYGFTFSSSSVASCSLTPYRKFLSMA